PLLGLKEGEVPALEQIEIGGTGDDLDNGGPRLLLHAGIFAGQHALPESGQHARLTALPEHGRRPAANAGIGVAAEQRFEATEKLIALCSRQRLAVAGGMTQSTDEAEANVD